MFFTITRPSTMSAASFFRDVIMRMFGNSILPVNAHGKFYGSGVTALFGKKISSLTEISKSFGTHLTIHDDGAIDWPDFLCE